MGPEGRRKPTRRPDAPAHKFRIGEKVLWSPQPHAFPKASGLVTIVSQMPPLGTTLQYRVKSARETHDQVALEHDLAREGNAGSVFS